MRTKFIFAAFVFLFGGLLSAHAQSQPCGCADKKDMLNYLNIGNAALQEYKLQLDRFSVTPEAYSEELLTAVLESVKNAERAVRLPGAGSSSLWLDDWNCSINEPAPSSGCLQAISRHYLEELQTICRATKGPRGASRKSYLEGMEMKFLVGKLISAHESTERYILKMLNSLPASCRPNDWFGYVVHQKVKTQEIKTNIPRDYKGYTKPSAGITLSDGGKEAQVHKWTYIGTIYVENGVASSAKGYAYSSSDIGKTLTGRTFCNYTNPGPDVAYVATNGTNRFAEGEGTGSAGFRLSVYPAKGNYVMNLSFFKVPISGTSSSFSNVVACRSEQKTFPAGTASSLESTPDYRFEAKLVPGSPDTLQGTKSETPPTSNTSSQEGNISLKSTYVLQTRWMLRRLPAK